MPFLFSYIATLVPLLVLDSLWLGLIAKKFYQARIGFLMTDNVQWWAVVLFYLLYAAGLSYFVVIPHSTDSFLRVFLNGAFLGLIAYAAYDLTNQAIVKNWPLTVTVADLLWGAMMSGLAALVAVFLMKSLLH